VQSFFLVWSKFDMKMWLYTVSKLLDIVLIQVLKEEKRVGEAAPKEFD